MAEFHKHEFTNETLLKLEIFQGYTREWLPVFLSGGAAVTHVNVFDFFAGPGADTSGEPGSPLIIASEVKAYLDDTTRPHASGQMVRLVFNDKIQRKCALLKGHLAGHTGDPRFIVEVWNLDFAEAYARALPLIRDKESANLIIMDQFGFRHVTPEVLRELTACPRTDIIFFVSSSHIRRFISADEIRRHVSMPAEQLRRVSNTEIHRFLCREYYQRMLPPGLDYNLVPFSIRKGANIYGLVFGTGSLLGLEKFLRVCWSKDKVSGDANFNIDHDLLRDQPGQLALFDEDRVPKKQHRFEHDLREFLRSAKDATNCDTYRYTLKDGFLPRHAGDILKQWQAAGELDVRRLDGQPARRGAFYLTWSDYKVGPSVCFSVRGF